MTTPDVIGRSSCCPRPRPAAASADLEAVRADDGGAAGEGTTTKERDLMTHDCPGECGRRVARHLFACRGCWFRLPAGLRHAISANYRRNREAHAVAMSDAVEWYAANRQGA